MEKEEMGLVLLMQDGDQQGRWGDVEVEERVYMMWLSSQVTVLWYTNEWAQAGGLGFVGL